MCRPKDVGGGSVVPWMKRRIRPNGLVGESAGTVHAYAGVLGVTRTDEDDAQGDDGGSEEDS